MNDTYRIVDEFEISNQKVLVLDKPRSIADFNTSKVVADKKKHEYSITHNREWIVVNTSEQFIGKEVVFE